MAGDGDVVLLSPGRYHLTDEASYFRNSIRIIGMGLTQQVWTSLDCFFRFG